MLIMQNVQCVTAQGAQVPCSVAFIPALGDGQSAVTVRAEIAPGEEFRNACFNKYVLSRKRNFIEKLGNAPLQPKEKPSKQNTKVCALQTPSEAAKMRLQIDEFPAPEQLIFKPMDLVPPNSLNVRSKSIF